MPAIVDDGRVVTDGWAIAECLAARYSKPPILFGGPGGLALSRLIFAWADQLNPATFRIVFADIHAVLHEQDQVY